MTRSVNPVPQYLDSAGNPLVAGKMFYFDSGTNTAKPTFADVSQKIPNTPVIIPRILIGLGRIFLGFW